MLLHCQGLLGHVFWTHPLAVATQTRAVHHDLLAPSMLRLGLCLYFGKGWSSMLGNADAMADTIHAFLSPWSTWSPCLWPWSSGPWDTAWPSAPRMTGPNSAARPFGSPSPRAHPFQHSLALPRRIRSLRLVVRPFPHASCVGRAPSVGCGERAPMQPADTAGAARCRAKGTVHPQMLTVPWGRWTLMASKSPDLSIPSCRWRSAWP